ncbi:MAG: hypothetical protein ABSH38_21850 [Verrucomicrobiota bacterium]
MKTRALALLAAATSLALTHAALAQATFTVGNNLVDLSQIKGNETDPSIAINTRSPSNLFVAAATDYTVPGLFVARSTNFGTTWATNIIATNKDAQGLVPAYGEPSVAWDTFGNLFVAYLPATFEGVAVVISTNGGKSFTALTNLAALDSTDTPRITTPALGAAAGSVWVVYKDYTLPNTPLVMQGLQSTGLGTNGGFGPVEIVPGSGAGGFPDIVAGPAGQVMVAFQGNVAGSGVAPVYICVNTNAISTNGFGTNFLAPVLAVSDAIGGFTYIAAEGTGIGINAAVGVAWDGYNLGTNYGKAYLVYTALSANGNLVINTCFSTNGGATWSAEAQVDDDLTGANDHFMPRLAVDPATGIIGYSWFDCRNDNGSSTPPVIVNFDKTYVFSNVLVTNINFIITNAATNNPSISYSVVDNTGGNFSNWTVTITGNNIYGTLFASDSTPNIYIYGATNTNFVLDLGTLSTNVSTTVLVSGTDYFPDAFTGGSAADQEAILYATVSLDGGMTFLPNQPLISFNRAINSPAVGYASGLSGSSSLTGWGHYTGLAAFGASFFPVWPDNSDILTKNPDGAGVSFDLYGVSGASNGAVTVPTADLSIFVTNSPNPVVSEGVLIYTLVVSNNGPQKASDVVVTNILASTVTLASVTPALGTIYSNFAPIIVFYMPTMPAHTALTNTIRVTATSSAFATNFASVSGPLIDLFPTNNTNQLVLLIAGEDLAMGMTTSQTNILIGDTVVTWITVTNLGPSTNGPVFITNTYSPNWTNFMVQAQGTFYITNNITNTMVVMNLGLLPTNRPVTAIVTATALSEGFFATNQAMVTSQDVDTNLSDNSATITYFINGEDLAVGGSAPPSANLSEPLLFTVSVTNFGLSYTGLITVSNQLSTNLALVSANQSQGFSLIADSVANGDTNNLVVFSLGVLGPGEVATMTISTVATGFGGPMWATNIASVTSSDFDPTFLDNTVTNVVVINGEDLAIGASAPPSVNLGEPFLYAISVTNFGLSTNGSVVVSNLFSTNLGALSVSQSQGASTVTNTPDGALVVFNLGTLDVGQVATMTISAVAVSGPPAAGIVSTVTSGDFDTNLANNATVSTILIQGEDLGVSISASPSSLQVSQVVTYTETVTNLGPSTNGTVLLTNTLSSKLGQITVLQPTNNYTVNGNVVVFNLGTLAAQQSVPITLTATALSTGSATTTAGVGSLDFDTNLANNTAQVTVTLTPTLPMISNIVVTPLASSAFIAFTTGALATAQVQYGLSTGYGSLSSVSVTPSSNHVVLLTGLARQTNYYFNILVWAGQQLFTTNGSFATVNTLILNTSDASYTGLWAASTVGNGIYGAYYQSANSTVNTETASATYTPYLPAAGKYNVSIWYPQSTNFTTNAQVHVSGEASESILGVNQTTNGGSWQPLVNDLYFASGTGGNVAIYNNTGETNKNVIANAMKWVYDPTQDYPTNGSVPAWWANYYFGPNATVSGSADADGDGYSNYAEYVFGTDPTDPASHLNFSVSYGPGNVVSVTFSPWQGGRAYALQSATDLSAGAWMTLTNTVTVDTNGNGVFTVTQPSPASAFYRLSAQILPQ